MGKLFCKLLMLFIIYYIVQFCFSFFGKGHEIDYKIINEYDFEINENYTSNVKGEHNNYYITIKVNDEEFNLQTFYDFDKKKKILKNISYYKNNNISCIYPEFINDKQLFDVICKKDNIYYNYTTLNDKDLVAGFVNKLSNYKPMKDNLNNYETNHLIKVFTDNVINNHYIGISNYKGVYVIKKNENGFISDAEIFENDVYRRPLSFYTNKYYVTANYEQRHTFDSFITIDLDTLKEKELKFDGEIYFDSYLLGIVDDSAYILDKTDKKEYEVDLKSFKIVTIGDKEKGVRFYQNGAWETIEMQDVINSNMKFKYDYVEDDGTIIHKSNNKKSGYNYYFKANNGKCDVYRSSVMNDNETKYLFTMNSCNNEAMYIDDYIYYIENTYVKYYSDIDGVKTLLQCGELNYNGDIIVGIYKNTK